MTTDKYDRMRALVLEHHAHQSRNGGHVPYVQHCERVRHLLAFVLDKTAEAMDEERENILLAGLGHDLLEDTMTDRDALREVLFREFGDGVVTLISEVTNTKGNEHVTAYVKHLATISDSARLIKFADLTENALNASYAVHENGPEKTRYWLEGLMLPQYNLLQSCKSSTTMPESTRLLNQFSDYALKAMKYAVASGPSVTSLA